MAGGDLREGTRLATRLRGRFGGGRMVLVSNTHRLALAVLMLSLFPTRSPRADASREIEIVASQFRFEPALIEVSEGERVVLNLRSADSAHGFAVKAFKVKAEIPKGWKVVAVPLVATKAGRFEFHCNEYCGAGHLQMKGTLVVNPRAN
jgi:cytochrome c oxidase subunit 2